MGTVIYLVTIGLLLVAFGYQLHKNPATMAIGTYGVFIVLSVILLCQHWWPTAAPIMAHVLLMSYVVASLLGVILLLSMAWYSWKKSRQLIVPIVIGSYLLSLVVLSPWHWWRLSAPWLLLYFVWQFCRFLISSICYGLVIQAPQSGPLVVLGGGLADGYHVGKIVDARIRAAVQDARQMATFPIIVFSGGQGEDQQRSEAEAMRDRAVSHYGVPESQTRLEDQSRNTQQNLRYSSDLLAGAPMTFYTSDYHVFRGALLAQIQGISAVGRGGVSVWRHRLPAFLREFAGVMSLHKRRQVLFGLLWVILAGVKVIFFS